ncbi:hypothetical protein [Nostoc sp. PA-18-2419]|uniref:hypothetical protein n=1 Tax=Nostoc sp. PA-18-2419 TaxID=2575443 RepID=UPI00110888ED|nr:hypothetical protein [Nostoc sp. PA-18-2419]
MQPETRGFITILTGLYSFQDCIHFLAAIRKFHQEPIIILIDGVPPVLYPFLKAFKNVILKPAPPNENTVLASREAKLALYRTSEFDKTIYLDSDICLLSDINDVFEYLDKYDLLLTEIKVLHCTYPYRPQYAKNITRSLYTRIFDRLAKVFLPNQVTNPWRKK